MTVKNETSGNYMASGASVTPGTDYTVFVTGAKNPNGVVVQCPATGVTTVTGLLSYFGLSGSVCPTNVPARASGAFSAFGQSGDHFIDG